MKNGWYYPDGIENNKRFKCYNLNRIVKIEVRSNQIFLYYNKSFFDIVYVDEKTAKETFKALTSAL